MRLARRDHRALVVGGVVMLSTLVVGRALPLWNGWVADARDRAWQAETRASRLRRLVVERDILASAAREAGRRYDELTPRLLEGSNAATVGASLLAIVSELAARSGLQLGSLQSTADSAGKEFVRVAVRGEATGDVRGVGVFLEALEGAPFLIGVRELAIDQPEPAAPDDQAEALRIQLVVEGLGLRHRDRP
jgi:hypothetical protein